MKKNKFFILSFLLIATIGMFSSCSVIRNIESPNISGNWVLKTIDGQSAGDVFKGNLPTLHIDTSEGTAYGSGGCNTYRGAYTLNNNMFSIRNAASTMMACIFENRESRFLEILSNPSRIMILNNELVLLQDNKQVLTFERETPLSSTDLTGTWQLESMGGASTNVSFPNYTPTMTFDMANERISGNAGCNNYGGTFYYRNGVLTVNNDVVATRMACEDMAGETQFLQWLSGDFDVSIENNMLVLRRDGSEVYRFVRE